MLLEEKQAIDKMNKFVRVHQDMSVVSAKDMDIVLKLVEKLKKENEELKQENKRIKYFSSNLFIDDYIPKRVIKNKIKEKQDKINKLHSASDCVIIDDLENQISVLQELLEGDKNE